VSEDDALARQRMLNLSSASRSRIWFGVACVMTGFAITGFLPADERRDWIATTILAIALGIAFGSYRSRRRRAEQAVAEQRAWLDALPFSVDGLWELFGQDLSQGGQPDVRLRFTVQFEDAAPEPRQLHQRLLDARVLELRALTPSDDRVELVLAIAASRMPAELAPVVHRLVDDALIPLHETHAIARARAGLYNA
jgi:hypothetical protein